MPAVDYHTRAFFSIYFIRYDHIFFISCNNGDPEGAIKRQLNIASAVQEGSELTLYDNQGKIVASYEVISTYRVEESKPVAELKK